MTLWLRHVWLPVTMPIWHLGYNKPNLWQYWSDTLVWTCLPCEKAEVTLWSHPALPATILRRHLGYNVYCLWQWWSDIVPYQWQCRNKTFFTTRLITCGNTDMTLWLQYVLPVAIKWHLRYSVPYLWRWRQPWLQYALPVAIECHLCYSMHYLWRCCIEKETSWS